MLALDDLNELLYQRLQEPADRETTGGRRIPEAVPAEKRLAKFLQLPCRSAIDLRRISKLGPKPPVLRLLSSTAP
jgi:hypothetical protein